ncbi:hypothetical protein [uncultured Roseovarius sp.]|uniref:hypothetical protein n=1 Tax=uncultured Roseovarius sp. TaxID=293344 RepID=UPI00262C07C5|nr:hypothetical protein [uncultured Roseovarius sp.]
MTFRTPKPARHAACITLILALTACTENIFFSNFSGEPAGFVPDPTPPGQPTGDEIALVDGDNIYQIICPAQPGPVLSPESAIEVQGTMPVVSNRYLALDPQTVTAPLECPSFQSTINREMVHFKSTDFLNDYEYLSVGWIGRAQAGTVVDFGFYSSATSNDHLVLSIQNLDVIYNGIAVGSVSENIPHFFQVLMFPDQTFEMRVSGPVKVEILPDGEKLVTETATGSFQYLMKDPNNEYPAPRIRLRASLRPNQQSDRYLIDQVSMRRKAPD